MEDIYIYKKKTSAVHQVVWLVQQLRCCMLRVVVVPSPAVTSRLLLSTNVLLDPFQSDHPPAVREEAPVLMF